VYAQHGRELKGLKSPVGGSYIKLLAESKGGRVTDRLEEAGEQNWELTNRNVI
jgi:hypothetical protein